MKKPKLSSFLLFACVLFVGIMMLVANSCKKDLHQQAASPKPATGDTSLMGQAKLWYQNNYPDVKTTTTLSTEDTKPQKTDWSKTFSPYWAKAQTFVTDSMTIIEMPALKKGDMALTSGLTNAGSFNFANSPSITSILIVIYKGYIGAYAMTIMGDDSYLQGNTAKLKNNTYRKKDNNFSGMVLYNAMDGTFINGWQYANGKVTYPLTQQVASTGTPEVNSINGKKVDVAQTCTQVTTTYWQDCSYYEDDVTYSNPFDCYDYSVQDIYTIPCSASPGGGSGGIAPPTPKCTPPTVSAPADASIKGHFIIDVAAPPPTTPTTGGTGTASQPCPVATIVPDTITVVFCGGLTTQEQNSIRSTVATFSTEDCASRFLYGYFGGQTISFCIKAGNYSTAYLPSTSSFVFDNDDMASPSSAFLLEHEFFHDYQNSTYPGGISAYSENATTGVNNPGAVNIEFEQAVFHDIATGGRTAFYKGTQQQQTFYNTWINSLTNSGTVYPQLSQGTTAYNQFITNYNSFLDEYNQIQNNQYSSKIINLTPQALINLFNIVTTPNC